MRARSAGNGTVPTVTYAPIQVAHIEAFKVQVHLEQILHQHTHTWGKKKKFKVQFKLKIHTHGKINKAGPGLSSHQHTCRKTNKIQSHVNPTSA